MKFENTDVYGFEHALRGMRNPKESWNRSDSHWVEETVLSSDDESYTCHRFEIGENDMDLAQRLIQAGSEHRKFMRQIVVWVDITAPMYWWKEFDTYKVGTVANSTSTMHRLTSSPITMECFEIDDMDQNAEIDSLTNTSDFMMAVVSHCEQIRQKYLETKDKKYWKELIRILPESWLQKRTVTMSYENLFAICGKGQRRFHKLNEWSGMDKPQVYNFIAWARTLPYAKELIFLDEDHSTQTLSFTTSRSIIGSICTKRSVSNCTVNKSINDNNKRNTEHETGI